MKVGSIGWCDLTVPDAKLLKDLYVEVANWEAEPLDMGGYDDYVMKPVGQEDGVAGICHAWGPNAGIPPAWLLYIVVASLPQAVDKCRQLGGEVIHESEGGSMAVIKDPAGAICALYQATAEGETLDCG
jgi:predicted enzyme related to lactoylglutathione lyase